MRYRSIKTKDAEKIRVLFETTFGASEGEEEGRRIGRLVTELMLGTARDDCRGYVAYDDSALRGAIFFSRLFFEPHCEAFILSPVAVDPSCQGRGVGQALINEGIAATRKHGVDLLFTYGDPAYYGKVGFEQIGEERIKAPLPLSQPEGWLCQPLGVQRIPTLVCRPRCVDALNHAELW